MNHDEVEVKVTGRRVISATDHSVIYEADPNAQLVPQDSPPAEPLARHDSNGSKAPGRLSIRKKPSSSEFSRQVLANRVYSSQRQHQADRVDARTVAAAISEPIETRTLPSTVYTPPVKTTPASSSQVTNRSPAEIIAAKGSSPRPSSRIANTRRRPPPLVPKRSLSNLKSKGEEFKRGLRDKLGLAPAPTQPATTNVEKSSSENDGPWLIDVPDKALRVLGAKAASTRAFDDSPASATSSKQKTPLHSASTRTGPFTASTTGSELAEEFLATPELPGQTTRHLQYLDHDSPPTPPSEKRPAVPPKDKANPPTKLTAEISPTRTGHGTPTTTLGAFRAHPEINNIENVKSVYGTFTSADDEVLSQGYHGVMNENGIIRLLPVNNYSPSVYQEPFNSLRPGPLHIPHNIGSEPDDSPSGASLSDVSAGLTSPEGQVEAPQNVQATPKPKFTLQETATSRDASGGSVAVPFYNDIPPVTIAESSAVAPRLAMALSTISTEFGLKLVGRILHDEAGESSVTGSQMWDMLKKKLDIIWSLTQITRLDTMEGIEQTIAELQTLSRHREASQHAYEAAMAQGTPNQSAIAELNRPAYRPAHTRDPSEPLTFPKRVLRELHHPPIPTRARADAPAPTPGRAGPFAPTPVPATESGTLLVDETPHRKRASTPMAPSLSSEDHPVTKYPDDTEQPMVFMMSGLGTPIARSPERPAAQNTKTVTRSNIVTHVMPALVANATRRNKIHDPVYDAAYVNGAPLRNARAVAAVPRAPRGSEYWEALGRERSNVEGQGGVELNQLRERQEGLISTLTQAMRQRGEAPPTEQHPAYRTKHTG